MYLRPSSYIPLVVLCMVMEFWAMTNFNINVSDSSTPRGLYRVRTVQLADLRRGDLVALRMPVKQIAALPGQHVMFAREGIYVEGKLIPNTAPEVDLVHFPFGSYTVPPYMFVGIGTLNPDSWDSRYAGFIPQSITEGTVTRVW
jgi:type IV secretory pathway protease TraF